MPFAADAAGLGKLTVLSALGEPLNAEIELIASKDELSSVSTRIAPNDVYAEQGLDRPAALSAIKVEVGKQANGNPVLKLSTAQPVNDPFLDMLIQVEWASGRLLREYTVLLDPPGYGEEKQAPATSQVATGSASAGTAETAPSTQTAKSGKAKRGARATAASSQEGSPAQQNATGEAYTTKQGDTLMGVAREMVPEGVSLEQMLVGLYRSNEGAFIHGNMNRMKVGQILRAPSSEDLQAVSQKDAAKEVRVHTVDWHAYRNKLAAEVAESAPQGETGQSQSASGKITSAAEEKAGAVPAGPRDVVKLSKSDTSGKAGGPEAPQSQQEKNNAAKENAIAAGKAGQEADARVASLEKQIQDMQKLLQVKNQALNDIQKGQAVTPAKPEVAAPAPQPAPEVKKPEVAAPQPEKAPEAAVSTQANAGATPPAAVPGKPETANPAVPKKPHKHKPAPVVVPPEPEPSLLEDPVMIGSAGGGLLALLGGLWWYIRNKRRKGLDNFEQGILTTSGLKPNTVFGNTAGGTVDTGDTSFLTDLSQGTSGMIDTNDVDPIAEAEVYMAYGRDVQAEEILKDAISKDPKRYELHQKLLEIYAHRKDTTAFETLAGELYATLGATDPTWQKFAAMGRELEPENPLYQSGGLPADEHRADVESIADETQSIADMSLDFTSLGSASSDIAPAAEAATETPAEDNGLDFDLGDANIAVAEPEAETVPDIPAVNEEHSPELAFPSEVAVESEVAVGNPPVEQEVIEAASDGLDFNFDLPEAASPGVAQLGAEELGLESPEKSEQAIEELPLSEAKSTEPEPAGSGNAIEEGGDLDLPELELQAFSEDLPPEATSETTAPPELATHEALAATEVPSLDFDNLALDTPAGVAPDIPVERPEEEIVLDSSLSDADDLNFDFDADFGETGDTDLKPSAEENQVLPDLDLSGISLDLEEEPPIELDTEPATAVEVEEQTISAPTEPMDENVEEITLAGNESADVETKLDLVAAYMDMGDTEGARELLEEVMREGGPQQRERAQGLLDSLG